jgi:transcriptional regulator with XRE-family HTH domain
MDRLAELRERRALTLRELSEMSGVAADTINQIELGHRKARPSTLRKLAKALDVDVREFFEEPALPLGEAPREAGPAQTTEKPRERGEGWEFRRAIELLMEAARKEALRMEQAANRAFESEQPQSMFTNELMDAGRRILNELEPVDMMEALRELAFERAQDERAGERQRAENARLRADLAEARELLREREQAYRELEEKSHS